MCQKKIIHEMIGHHWQREQMGWQCHATRLSLQYDVDCTFTTALSIFHFVLGGGVWQIACNGKEQIIMELKPDTLPTCTGV